MSRNNSGTYTLPAGNPVVSGSVISSVWANDTMSDIATTLTDSLSRSGKGGMTAAFRSIDGAVATPGMSFNSETGSGLYRAGAGDVRLAILGADVIKATAAGAAITGTLSVTGDTTLTGNLAVNGQTITSTSSTSYYPQTILRNKTADVNAGYYVFDKDRAGAIVQSGDILGNVIFRGYDGANYVQAAAIIAYVNGTPGTNDMPGSLGIFTTADGASSPTRRVYIDQAGDMTLDHINSNTSTQAANVYADANGKLHKGIASTSRTPAWTYFTASGTYTVPAGVTSIRAYAGGGGGNGSTSTSANVGGGGGGGFAYGDIAVTPGQTVTISISSGVATVTYASTTMLTANKGGNASGSTGGTAGTASKNVAVTNGGAYSGGAGASGINNAGGGSCGSPLGNGFTGGTSGGGAGIGSSGVGSQGGGAGTSSSGAGTNGDSRPFNSRFTDPLLTYAFFPFVSNAAGGPGAGGDYGTTGLAGGDFGGGGAGFYGSGTGTVTVIAGNGGVMGGGGAGYSASSGTTSVTGGNGGLGGGGGSARSAVGTLTAGTGGGAFVFICA